VYSTLNHSIISALIIQNFNSLLLHRTFPDLYDDSERLWKMYLWINNKLKKKCIKDPIRLEKYLKLEKEFLELYGRAKTKEEEFEEEDKRTRFSPFYGFKGNNKRHPKLLDRIKQKSYHTFF